MNRRRGFRVGTFNLCNLVLPNTLYYERDQYSPETYARKKLWSAGQLERMRADIIGFQEVFHQQALQEVLEQSLYCRDYHLITAAPTGADPVVALASRFPILQQRMIQEFPIAARLSVQGAEIPLTHFSRPILFACLQLTETVEVAVFVVHLKSKRGIFPAQSDRHDPIELAKAQARSLMLRAAESIALRVTLMEVLQNRNYPVIVIGDLNDGGTAVTSQIISGEAPPRHFDPEQKRKVWDVLLYHVKDIQARQSYGDFYYTHIHNGHYESLDHIMVSQEFVSQNPDRMGRVEYVSVFNDHLMDDTLSHDQTPNWQSDHGQVVASIELERDLRAAPVRASRRTSPQMSKISQVKASRAQIAKKPRS